MPSNLSAVLSTIFNIQGISYSISSACTTSSNCIGHSFELIRMGKQDIIFSGASEELSADIALCFDSMNVLSKRNNFFPHKSSCPYDVNRDGFVISGGSGIIVLEELNHALSRSCYIYGEIIAYSSCSDGFSITNSSVLGSVYCMKDCLKKSNRKIDYLNTHGTSTILGDKNEVKSILEVFSTNELPYISSTKSITGHSLGSSGVQELIYCLLMFKYNFIAPSINIKNLDPFFENLNIVFNTVFKKINTIMSNNFGFGGSNVSLIVSRFY